jgi:hypothetical protein
MLKTTKVRARLPHDPNKVAAIRSTANHFKVTETYVRRAVSGDADYGRSEEIKKHFTKVFNKINSITGSN